MNQQERDLAVLEDPLAPARGMLLGMLLSAEMWMLIIAALLGTPAQ